MGEPLVNGEKPHSEFLSHLTSYPVVSDSLTTFKNNKYGATSLKYADQGYERIAKPFLPYLSSPYVYVAPYLAKVDSLGDQGLTKLDERFPIVKEDTERIKSTLVDTVYFPVRLVDNARKHVFDTYGSEYKKCGGDGYVASGKAVITTGLVISQESLGLLSSYLADKKQQTKEVANDKINN